MKSRWRLGDRGLAELSIFAYSLLGSLFAMFLVGAYTGWKAHKFMKKYNLAAYDEIQYALGHQDKPAYPIE